MYSFSLAACAEMLWLDKPIDWRASRLKELGFGVGLWNWPDHDIAALQKTGADFTIMNGYLEGTLSDDDGADQLLASVKQTIQRGKQLGVDRLNLHGTGLGDGGIPIKQADIVTGQMWLKARDTLERVCDIAEKEEVDLDAFHDVGIILNSSVVDKNLLDEFIEEIKVLKANGAWKRDELIALFNKTIPNFNHIEKNSFLDKKM